MKRLAPLILIIMAATAICSEACRCCGEEISRRVARALAAGPDSALVLSAEVESTYWLDSTTRDDSCYALYLAEMLRAGYPDSLRSRYMLEVVHKNMPGTAAADFTFTDRRGRQSSLYDFVDRTTILFFYDPDCHTCHDVAHQLMADSTINVKIAAGELKVLAIGATDPDEWRAHGAWLPDTPSGAWTDATDSGAIDADDLYTLDTYPTIYLLSPTRHVILRNATLRLIIETIKSHASSVRQCPQAKRGGNF